MAVIGNIKVRDLCRLMMIRFQHIFILIYYILPNELVINVTRHFILATLYEHHIFIWTVNLKLELEIDTTKALTESKRIY